MIFANTPSVYSSYLLNIPMDDVIFGILTWMTSYFEYSYWWRHLWNTPMDDVIFGGNLEALLDLRTAMGISPTVWIEKNNSLAWEISHS